MKFKISYFARIRKFAPNEIPVSTAMWDPKWFHPHRNPKGVYLDKRNVINGLRVDPFVPKYGGCDGPRNCGWEPGKCTFISKYEEQLAALDWLSIHARFADLEARLRERYPHLAEYPELTFVLIVYEKPDNECSERHPIRQWFTEVGASLPEWELPKEG